MSIKRKQEVAKSFVKNAIVDQLLVSEPASLGIDTLLRGVQCKFGDYSQEALLALLNDMCDSHELLKLIDAESGARFKLASAQTITIDEEGD